MTRPPSRRFAARSEPVDRPTHASKAVARTAPQEVRLIGGQLKRTPLQVPDWPGLRPTPARVRETLFNWLGQDMTGWRVLDAFAGSGALGLEAASRGASEVTLLERERVLARHLQATVGRLGLRTVQVLNTDAMSWMSQASLAEGVAAPFDLVLLDPPFDAELFDAALTAARRLVPVGGWIYLEANRAYGPATAAASETPWPEGLRLHRAGQAGAVHYHLIERVD